MRRITDGEFLAILAIGVAYLFFGIHEVGDPLVRVLGGNIALLGGIFLILFAFFGKFRKSF